MKGCSQCKKTLPFLQFNKRALAKSGYSSNCKTCVSKKQSGYSLKHKFGLDEYSYKLLLQLQDYRCIICKSPSSKFAKRLHVDHSHTTGVIRGLLCSSCNMALGLFKDNSTSLKRALNYLDPKGTPWEDFNE